MQNAIEVHNLFMRYPGNDRNTINGCDLTVKQGEAVALAGLSGCGKSSLCYCICGLIPKLISAKVMGEIKLFGAEVGTLSIKDRAAKIGIVFQEPDNQLFSPTIEDEIAFAPENLCLSREEIGARIEESLAIVGLERYRLDSPSHLSGGQKQLIALASVLAMRPEILIFDEVMSQIDRDGKKRIKETIEKLKKAGKTILMVEHDFENMDVADRIIVMREGKLYPFEGEL